MLDASEFKLFNNFSNLYQLKKNKLADDTADFFSFNALLV